MNTRESARSQKLPGPRPLLYRTIGLLVANLALAIWPGRHEFMPSDLAIGLGFAFGMLCAGYHVHSIRLARRRVKDLDGPEYESIRRTLGKPLLVLALVHLALGAVGFAKGVASLYTAAFGRRDEITYIVFDVAWKARKIHCYKYTFGEMSMLRNYLSAPCLDLEYPPGTRFHYSGLSTPLGFKHDHVEIESEPPPPQHKPRR